MILFASAVDLVILMELCSRITIKREGQKEFQHFHPVLSLLSYLLKVRRIQICVLHTKCIFCIFCIQLCTLNSIIHTLFCRLSAIFLRYSVCDVYIYIYIYIYMFFINMYVAYKYICCIQICTLNSIIHTLLCRLSAISQGYVLHMSAYENTYIHTQISAHASSLFAALW
jgi:hypothetical protein